MAAETAPGGIVKLNSEKQKRLQAISRDGGIIAALALDQRGSLAALMKAASERQPERSAIEEFKSAVSEALTPDASAILLDLEYGGQAILRRAPKTGLILTYEEDAYVNTAPHRPPGLIPGLSVKRLKESGADCVKLLVHYAPDAPPEINASKRSLVERVGRECADQGMPFLLEVVGYDVQGAGEQSLDYARRKPAVVTATVEEFSRAGYAVDVLKVEIPVNLKYVAGTASFQGVAAYSLEEALNCFRLAARATAKPFIYLSAGVSASEFVESLHLAAEAGVPFSGVLCGRAIWQEGARVFARDGRRALDQWLDSEGRKNIREVVAALQKAHAWDARAAAPSP
jgi:tagatose 1,6-diphosphate aldolase